MNLKESPVIIKRPDLPGVGDPLEGQIRMEQEPLHKHLLAGVKEHELLSLGPSIPPNKEGTIIIFIVYTVQGR